MLRAIKSILLVCTALLLAGVPHVARAADIDARPVVVQTALRAVTVQYFAAPGGDARPAVVILHGVQGIDAFPDFYRRYAAAIAASGIDAYLVPYYDDAELARAKGIAGKERRAVFDDRCRAWSSLVSEVVSSALAQGRSSGRVGVLGFSQGGFLATAVAAQDSRISALVVFYGGLPSILRDAITRLPPLLELHGDADDVVALAYGQELVDRARQLGQASQIVVYPGAGHGFDGADAIDAQRRTLAFFRQGLLAE